MRKEGHVHAHTHAPMKTDGRQEIEERRRLRGGDRAGATAETAEWGASGNGHARVDAPRVGRKRRAHEEGEGRLEGRR